MERFTANFARLCVVVLLLISSFGAPLLEAKVSADVPAATCQDATNHTSSSLAVPTLLTPSNDSTDTNGFDFSWTGVSGATQYDWESSLMPGLNADGSFMSQTSYHRLDTTSINEGGSSPATYYWHVRAVASDGTTSAWSQTWKVSISDAQTSYLSAPALLFPSNGATCDIYTQDFTFSWSAPSSDGGLGPLRYIFQSGRSASTDPVTGEFTDQPWTDYNIDTTSIFDGGSASATYYWHIRAVGNDGTLGPWTATWVVTINHDAPVAPVVPTTPAPPTPPANNTGNPTSTNPTDASTPAPSTTPISTPNATSNNSITSLFAAPSTDTSVGLDANAIANPSKTPANKTPQPANLAADYATIHNNRLTRNLIRIIAIVLALSAAIFAFRRRQTSSN